MGHSASPYTKNAPGVTWVYASPPYETSRRSPVLGHPGRLPEPASHRGTEKRPGNSHLTLIDNLNILIERTMKRIWIPQVIVCAMLLWALNPANPYGYYTLLRWVCCGVFGFLAFKAFDLKMQGLTWVLGITALVYNPIFPVHLTRAIWSAANIATIIIAVASIIYLKKGEKT